MPRVILLVCGCTEALTKVWRTSNPRLSSLARPIFLEVVKEGLRRGRRRRRRLKKRNKE